MARYREAIQWIALNDDTETRTIETIASYISVCLVADLWKKTPRDVAMDVIIQRTNDRLNREHQQTQGS